MGFLVFIFFIDYRNVLLWLLKSLIVKRGHTFLFKIHRILYSSWFLSICFRHLLLRKCCGFLWPLRLLLTYLRLEVLWIFITWTIVFVIAFLNRFFNVTFFNWLFDSLVTLILIASLQRMLIWSNRIFNSYTFSNAIINSLILIVLSASSSIIRMANWISYWWIFVLTSKNNLLFLLLMLIMISWYLVATFIILWCLVTLFH